MNTQMSFYDRSGLTRTLRRAALLAGTFMLLSLPAPAQTSSRDSGNCRMNVSVPSILSGLHIDRSLRIVPLIVNCVPKPASAASRYVYEPYHGQKFATDLKDSAGRLVNSFVWYGEVYFKGTDPTHYDSVKLTRYEIVGGDAALKELSSGGYTLEFAVDGKVFQSFPFSVLTKKSTDVYQPGTIYLLEGGWRDEAIFTAASVENVMCFNVRLRAGYEQAAFKPVSVVYQLTLTRTRDKQLIGEQQNGKLILKTTWENYRLCFDRPNREASKEFSALKMKEILAVDGAYTIALSIDGKPYATYKLNVDSGKINGLVPPARMINVTLPATILAR
jgi:hypothetical protein